MVNKGNRLTFIGAISCFLLTFFAIHYWANLSHDILQSEHKKLLQELTISQAGEIEHQINRSLYSQQWLISQLKKMPLDLKVLAPTIDSIIEQNREITQISFSPQGTTSHVFPSNINKDNKLVKFNMELLGNSVFHVELQSLILREDRLGESVQKI